MNLSERDRRAVIYGCLVLGVLFIGKFVVLPFFDHWKALRDRADAQELDAINEARRAKRLIDTETRVSKHYGKNATNPLTDIETTRLAFLKATQKLLTANGIAVENLQPQSPRSLREAKEVSVLSLRVTGKTQLPQLAKTLAAIPNADCLMFVDRLDVAGDPKQPGNVTVTMTLATLAQGDAP